MDKIQKMSKYILFSIKIFIIIIPISIIMSWLFIDSPFLTYLIEQGFLFDPVVSPTGSIYLNNVSWANLSKLMGCTSTLIQALPGLLSLYFLKKLFANYAKGDIFNVTNAKYFNQIAWLFFWHALLAKPLGEGLAVTAVTLSNAPGKRYFAMGFGTPNLEALFYGVLIIIVSWVMLEASKLYDEQKFVV